MRVAGIVQIVVLSLTALQSGGASAAIGNTDGRFGAAATDSRLIKSSRARLIQIAISGGTCVHWVNKRYCSYGHKECDGQVVNGKCIGKESFECVQWDYRHECVEWSNPNTSIR